MPFRFDRDPTFRSKLLTSAEVEALVADRAEAVADRARELAPDDPNTPTSSIAEGIEVDVAVEGGHVVARVNATDWKSHFHEFGTVKMPAHPFLRPAAEQELGALEAAPDDSGDA